MLNVTALDSRDEFDGQRLTDTVQRFAVDNNFQYLGAIGQGYRGLDYAGNTSPAWMRNKSLASTQIHAVRTNVENYEVTMFVDLATQSFSSNYDTQSVSNFYNYNVIDVKLHKIFPQLVLDSNKNDKYSIKIRGAAIKASQKINLEGDFSSYFDFYAPKDINANSLTVLAPNFMRMLIDSAGTFDVEIFGDHLTITTQDPLFTKQIMAEAFDALREQLKYMERLETSWNYQPLEQPFDTLKLTKLENFYSMKIGKSRIGLVQLILILFGIFTFLMILPLIIGFIIIMYS